MIARYTGAVLGLLAFSVATLGGLAVGNPPSVVLSRALGSLVVFCFIGLGVGMAAQAVIKEYECRKTEEPGKSHKGGAGAESAQQEETNKSTSPDAEPMGT